MSEKIKIGGVEVKLDGRPFVIEVDTFSYEDYFGGYFDTNQEAIDYAKKKGGTMHKVHAYDKDGRHIGEGGDF